MFQRKLGISQIAAQKSKYVLTFTRSQYTNMLCGILAIGSDKQVKVLEARTEPIHG